MRGLALGSLLRKIEGSFRNLQHRWRRWYGPKRMNRIGGYYNGRNVVRYMSPQAGNARLREALLREQSFVAARYGTYELMAVAYQNYGFRRSGVLKRLCLNAGFFPREEALLNHFAEVYTEATKCIDYFCAWNFRHGLWRYEERVFREYCPEATLTDIGAIHFLKHDDPWTTALEGKRVLVVHPFVDTIERQYRKRQLLFPDRDVLPPLRSLETLRAVQSAGGNEVPFQTWFEALDYMKDQMEGIDFDVALVGAGAYGLPLVAHARELGKQAVHTGGITQMLFGIMGKRWESHYGHLMNDHWTRPTLHEAPPQAERIEGGAYW